MSDASLKRNAVYNAGAALVPVATSLVTTPLLLGALGNARFGIVALVWLLFGYFGLFDLGLSQATSNRLAKTENGADARQADIVWSALAVNALFGALGGAVFYGAAPWLLAHMGSVPTPVAAELQASILWIALLVPASTVNAVFAGTLESRERFGVLNAWQSVGTIAGQLVPLGAVLCLGGRLDIALEATVLARLLAMVPVAWLALAQLEGAVVAPRWSVVKDLLAYGGWITATNLVSPLLVSADHFAIGRLLGVAAVPHYSVPFNLAAKVLIIPSALTRAMFPRMSRGTAADALAQASTAMVVLGWGLALVCVPAMFLVEPALQLWIGDRFAREAAPVSRVLLVGVWINGLAFVPYTLLQSQGRPDIPAKLHWIEVVPFLAALWICIHQFGLVGAAVAWGLRVAFDGGCLTWAAGLGKVTAVRLLAPFSALLCALVLSSGAGAGLVAALSWAVAGALALACAACAQEASVRQIVGSARARYRWLQ